MFTDVLLHGCGQQVFHRQSTTDKQSHFCTGHVVLDKLRNEVYIVPPTSEAARRLVHARSRALDDEGTISAQNMVKLRISRTQNEVGKYGTHVGIAPYAGFAHRADQIRTSKEHQSDMSTVPFDGLYSPTYGINLIFEMIKHDGGSLVIL
jgi:hypothetical protein